MRYSKDRHIFKYKAIFNTTVEIEKPSGLVVTEPQPVFSRICGIHKASSSYIQTLEGYDRSHDLIIVINSVYKDNLNYDFDYNVYTVTFRDKEYVISGVDLDDGSSPNGFHLIHLRDKRYQTDG